MLEYYKFPYEQSSKDQLKVKDQFSKNGKLLANYASIIINHESLFEGALLYFKVPKSQISYQKKETTVLEYHRA